MNLMMRETFADEIDNVDGDEDACVDDGLREEKLCLFTRQ